MTILHIDFETFSACELKDRKARKAFLVDIEVGRRLDITKTLRAASARSRDPKTPDILDTASVRQSIDSMTEMAALLGRLGVK